MHANEALNARAELKNTEVMSLTSLWEPELRPWGSALKVAQHVGCNERCHLKIHAQTKAPVLCSCPLPGPRTP